MSFGYTAASTLILHDLDKYKLLFPTNILGSNFIFILTRMLFLFIFVILQGITSVSSAIQIHYLLIAEKEAFKYLTKSCYACRNRTEKVL